MPLIRLPQLAWYGTKELELPIPDSWQAEVYNMAGFDRPAMKPDEIKVGITNLIGSPPIRELARGKNEVVIIFDDMTRVTRMAELVPFVLEELAEAGIRDNRIQFICATGTHMACDRLSFVQATRQGGVNLLGKEDKNMAQISPKVKVTGINQVCLVVKDLQKTMENYWNILGIGPWDIYAWEAPLVYDYKYHGKPAWARVKLALTQVGAVQFELVEHLDGDSIYRDFLMEHGEGLHHINFFVDDVDETAKILVEQGFPSLQSARFGDNGAYNYIDIKPLHAIWEVVHLDEKKGAEVSHYPSTAQTSSARVKVTRINQVSLVVRDLQKVVENYWHILGIGPWDIYSWEAPLIYERKYYGKPVWAREKIAMAQVGGVQLELCQPIDGESIYQDYLMECGEGLHHLNFLVDNLDETVEILAGEGFPSLQSGRYGDNGAYNYIDVKPLHAIWEVVLMPSDMGLKATRYPEDSA